MSGGGSLCSSLSKIRCVVSFVFQKKPSFHSANHCFIGVFCWFFCLPWVSEQTFRFPSLFFTFAFESAIFGTKKTWETRGSRGYISFREAGKRFLGPTVQQLQEDGDWPCWGGEESAGRLATTRNQLDHESVKSVGISLFRVLLVRDDILPCYVWIISEIIIRIHIYQPVSNGKYEV